MYNVFSSDSTRTEAILKVEAVGEIRSDIEWLLSRKAEGRDDGLDWVSRELDSNLLR